MSNIWNTLAQSPPSNYRLPSNNHPLFCAKKEIIPPPSYYLRKHNTGEWLMVIHPLYLGSHPRLLSLPKCTIGSQAVSLWSSLRWWSGTGRNEWRGCTPPLILWLIAHRVTLTKELEYWHFGDSFFNLLKGIFLFVSPIPFSFLKG